MAASSRARAGRVVQATRPPIRAPAPMTPQVGGRQPLVAPMPDHSTTPPEPLPSAPGATGPGGTMSETATSATVPDRRADAAIAGGLLVLCLVRVIPYLAAGPGF